MIAAFLGLCCMIISMVIDDFDISLPKLPKSKTKKLQERLDILEMIVKGHGRIKGLHEKSIKQQALLNEVIDHVYSKEK